MPDIILPSAPFKFTRKLVTFGLDDPFEDIVPAYLELQERNGVNRLRVSISKPRRERSTGKGSQNTHFHGHCQDIANQTGNALSVVKETVKEYAVEWLGYPTVEFCRKQIPQSEADCSVEEATLLIDAVHLFADEWDFALIEAEDA